MKTINKIMVAVDFSDYSEPAVQYAVDLAQDVSAELLLANIYNERDIERMEMVAARVPEFSVDKHVGQHMEDRRQRLAALAEKLVPGDIDVETPVRIGVPYKGLLQLIEEKKPDLLVMGTKGRSNFVDMIIGSCAQKMFRRSPIPLLSIRESQSKENDFE